MMACLNIHEMQGYLEDSESAALRHTVESHLAGCGKCQSVFDRLATTSRRVNTWLSELALHPEEAPALDMAAAYARVMNQASPVTLLNVELPWYTSLYRGLRDLVHPEKLPPLELTSRPVPVKEIWGLYASDPKNRFYSVGVHVLALTLLLVTFTSPVVKNAIQNRFTLVDPNIKAYVPEKPKSNAMQGGGGGGAHEVLPATRGQAPKPALKVFVPPMVTDHTPKLAMDPAILAPPDTPLPQSNLNNWGDPLAKIVNGSNGTGSGGGIGDGKHGGLGSGDGPGYGPGSNGGFGGEVYRVGTGGVTAPIPILRIDPEYSEEARKAKFSGTVEIALIVDTEGRPRNIHIARGIGMGLDEKAEEAVSKWRFKPGFRNGVPVNVIASVLVTFRLL